MAEEDSRRSAYTHTRTQAHTHTFSFFFLEVSTGHFSSLFCSFFPLSGSRGPAGGAFALLTRACPGNTGGDMQTLQHPERLAIHMKMEHFRYLKETCLAQT